MNPAKDTFVGQLRLHPITARKVGLPCDSQIGSASPSPAMWTLKAKRGHMVILTLCLLLLRQDTFLGKLLALGLEVCLLLRLPPLQNLSLLRSRLDLFLTPSRRYRRGAVYRSTKSRAQETRRGVPKTGRRGPRTSQLVYRTQGDGQPRERSVRHFLADQPCTTLPVALFPMPNSKGTRSLGHKESPHTRHDCECTPL